MVTPAPTGVGLPVGELLTNDGRLVELDEDDRARYGSAGSVRGDPHWITARCAGECVRCEAHIFKGDRAWYWPYNKQLECGPCGAESEARFAAVLLALRLLVHDEQDGARSAWGRRAAALLDRLAPRSRDDRRTGGL